MTSAARAYQYLLPHLASSWLEARVLVWHIECSGIAADADAAELQTSGSCVFEVYRHKCCTPALRPTLSAQDVRLVTLAAVPDI